MVGPGVIRRLWPIERDRITDHLHRLDPESRRLRFGGLVGPEQIEAHRAGLDWRQAVIVGYLEAGELRGLGELLPIKGDGPRAAELAVSVEPRWQNRGIGTALLRRLIVAARNRLIGRLIMVCLIDNGRVLRMARRFEGRLQFDRGEALARIEPSWPTWWTLLEETLDAAPVLLRHGIAAAPTGQRHGRRAGRKKAALHLTSRGERRIQVGRKRLKSRNQSWPGSS
jgi:GNAT superfamily N-acetyltransferase